MKTLIFYLFSFSLLLSCKNDHALTFEQVKFKNEVCLDCPQVSITIPKALEKNKISQTINTALREEIISLLLFDEAVEANSIPTAILAFKEGFHELQEQHSDENTIWKAKIDASISYEDATVLTLELSSYLFTGGAHGYSAVRLLNFDKKKGEELENLQLFINKNDFQKYAETKFRIQEKIPQDKPINETGFMFDNNSFKLPENIGYAKNGLLLIYNQYEVGSYADGPIEVVLPYTEVKKYLALRTTL